MGELCADGEDHQDGADPGCVVDVQVWRQRIESSQFLLQGLLVDVRIICLGEFEKDVGKERCNFGWWERANRIDDNGCLRAKLDRRW